MGQVHGLAGPILAVSAENVPNRDLKWSSEERELDEAQDRLTNISMGPLH